MLTITERATRNNMPFTCLAQKLFTIGKTNCNFSTLAYQE